MKSMQSLQNPEYVAAQLKRLVEANRHSEIRLNANGGNSILVTCLPAEENNYIRVFQSALDKTRFQIIDLNELLVSFVENNKEELEKLFELLSGSIYQIFKSADSDEDNDLFSSIMLKIKQSIDDDKIPVLIRTGTLYGSGIESIHIMEHQIVMRSPIPLIILYPAVSEQDKIMFLSTLTRPASKYRCMILN